MIHFPRMSWLIVPMLVGFQFSGPAGAQSGAYPTKPIRLLVPFTPGGGTDIVARIIAQKVSEAVGQPVVVDNRPGAGGTVGAETAVRANPDGYTLIMVSGSYGTNAAVYKLPYDPIHDIQIQLVFGAMPAALPHVRGGRLRGLAVTGLKRAEHVPDLPTVAEVLPGYEVVLWYGVLGPKGLAKSVVARWNAEVTKALQTKEMKERMAGEGLEPVGGVPEHFLKVIQRDVEKWRKVVRDAKVTVAN